MAFFVFSVALVNVALGLSRVRFREYLLGSAAGLVGPIIAVSIVVHAFS